MSVNLAYDSYVSASVLIEPLSFYDPVGLANIGGVTESGEPMEPVPIYRGFSGGSYVYSIGSPPGGATFITIIGYQ
jgi:hypothetical protein